MSKESEDRVTFKDKYNQCKTWQEKAICIALYHTIMLTNYPTWTITDTASHFKVSIGLISENIRLAREIDKGNKLVINAKYREDALKLIERRRYVRERNSITIFKLDEE